jgi:thiosulfate reductase cytochrome b subunit
MNGGGMHKGKRLHALLIRVVRWVRAVAIRANSTIVVPAGNRLRALLLQVMRSVSAITIRTKNTVVMPAGKRLRALLSRIIHRVNAVGTRSKRSAGRSGGKRLHPLPVRIMHWVNAIAMIVMITSGWGIYNDYVIISGLHFPKAMRLGSWAAESLLWHFAGMWFLAINGFAYLLYGVITGRFRERLLPIRLSDIVKTVNETLHFKIAHDDLTVYNAVQKVLYVIVIFAGVSQVFTGLAIWKPIQFSLLVSLFGGFQGARLVHFLGMAVIVGFLVVHVALSLLVPSTLWAMLTGGPRIARPKSRIKAET